MKHTQRSRHTHNQRFGMDATRTDLARIMAPRAMVGVRTLNTPNRRHTYTALEKAQLGVEYAKQAIIDAQINVIRLKKELKNATEKHVTGSQLVTINIALQKALEDVKACNANKRKREVDVVRETQIREQKRTKSIK